VVGKLLDRSLQKIYMSFKKGHTVSKEVREKIRNSLLGHYVSPETRKKIGEKGKGRISPNKGRTLSEEWKRKMVETRRRKGSYKRGEAHPNWKGGMQRYSELERLRKSLMYRLWREAVFEKDNYTCVWCLDKTGGNLEADHIKPFATHPDLRFAIDNGRTLCKDCHKMTDTYAGKGTKRIKR
jgi:hypothetical protein